MESIGPLHRLECRERFKTLGATQFEGQSLVAQVFNLRGRHAAQRAPENLSHQRNPCQLCKS
jgi:hypothetical protein